MTIGTMLHHKFFNGVANEKTSLAYQKSITSYFKTFGMRGTGIMGMVAPSGPDPDTYTWQNVDKVVAFCEARNLSLHYNTVLSGHLDAYPQWFRDLPRNGKEQALEKHVRAVVGRYKGRVDHYKLMNETLGSADENFLDTGKDKADVVAQVFRWARDEFPEGKFMLNEHSPCFRKDRREKLLELVRMLHDRDAGVDIIGLQAHMGYHPKPFQLPPDDEVSHALCEIHEKTGAALHITEFDLSWNNSPLADNPELRIDPVKPFEIDGIRYTDWYQYQAFAYRHFAEVCREIHVVEAFYYWAFNEHDAWERPDCGLFDEQFNPWPEMKDWCEEIRGASHV